MTIRPTYYRPSSSSSSNNPCPEGYEVAATIFNETMFLICNLKPPKDEAKAELDLILGLSLGLGIPFLLFLCCCCCRSEYPQESCLWKTCVCLTSCKCDDSNDIAPVTLTRHEILLQSLSGQNLIDFRKGDLTEDLKAELMKIRIRGGSTLTFHIDYATQDGHHELAAWIAHLNPLDIPLNILSRPSPQTNILAQS
jgi:hypothetical protein